MHADSPKYLWDVQNAATLIERFVSGRSYEDYVSDPMLKSAVERQLEIIGEALNALSRRDPATAKAIPDLARIVSFRNVLIHGYASVDDKLVWGVVEAKLSTLRHTITDLLAPS